MGLFSKPGMFSKKETCSICGEEVKGLFPTRIGGKRPLCGSCSKQVSMDKALLETATPEFIQEHLEYRRKNAEKYATHHWTVRINSIPGLQFGLDEAGRAIYLVHNDLGDDEENPVVFSFDQLTDYGLFRRKKKLDSMEDVGLVVLETSLSMVLGKSRMIGEEKRENTDSFHLKLTTTDPYWEKIDLKIDFTDSQLYGIGGFAKDMRQVCQTIKSIILKKPIYHIL